jgi:predicted dehydrogenase
VVNCRVNSPGLTGSFWAADPTYGGAIVGEGCHFVDLMYWLLGSEPTSVAAYSLPLGKGDPIGQNNIVSSFSFADGSVGNLTYCTVGTKTSGGERVEVFAPGIAVSTENFTELKIKGDSVNAKTQRYGEKGYRPQMRAFIESLRSGEPAEVSVRDGARATIGCLRMLKSSQSGGPLAIDLDAVLS